MRVLSLISILYCLGACSGAKIRDSGYLHTLSEMESKPSADGTPKPAVATSSETVPDLSPVLPPGNKITTEKTPESPAIVNPPTQDQLETISVPISITGVNLTCSFIAQADAILPAAHFGCLVTDENSALIPRSIKRAYTVLPPAAKGLVVYNRKGNAESLFDVYYELSGFDFSKNREFALNTEILVTIDPRPGELGSKNLRGVVKDVLKPAPRPIWKPISINNELSYVDQLTGISWSPDLNAGFGDSAAAGAHCDKFFIQGEGDWRIPTVDEMLMAHEHQIFQRLSSPATLNVNSVRGGYWSNSKSTGGNWLLVDFTQTLRTMARREYADDPFASPGVLCIRGGL